MGLSAYGIDGPVPELPPEEALGMDSVRRVVAGFIKASNLTIRQAYQTRIPLTSGPAMKGRAAQVADQMEDWYMSGACDGLMIGTPVSTTGPQDFFYLVVPHFLGLRLFLP